MCQLASKYKKTPTGRDEMKMRIESSLERLSELNKISNGNLEVKVLNYPLSFNIGAYNLGKRNSAIYIEYHSYRMNPEGLAKIVVTSEDKSWYSYFEEQINTIWNDGKKWVF
jgi:hypothetical protein